MAQVMQLPSVLLGIVHIFSFFPHYWVVGEKLQGAALLQLS